MRNKRNKQYYQLATVGNVAELNIFGDITAYPCTESDVSAENLSKQLAELKDVKQINVNINSYGGEVMEGLAIYNALKRHKAHVTTYCDGAACSIASVIFMAGDERVMCKPSFLMIHDAWTICGGNADALRKQADDLDVITSASVTAYMEHVNISEEKLRALMKAETWLTHDEAVEMGFATGIEESSNTDKPSQSVRNKVFEMLSGIVRQAEEEDEKEDDAEAPKKPANAPDTSDDKEPDEEEKDDDAGAQEPSDDDNKKSNEKTPDDNKKHDENDENDEDPDKPAQKWSGFFNAIFG